MELKIKHTYENIPEGNEQTVEKKDVQGVALGLFPPLPL